jgi:hypothetical protein
VAKGNASIPTPTHSYSFDKNEVSQMATIYYRKYTAYIVGELTLARFTAASNAEEDMMFAAPFDYASQQLIPRFPIRNNAITFLLLKTHKTS